MFKTVFLETAKLHLGCF